VQKPSLVGIAAVGDCRCDPTFQPRHLFVARRQHADGDQNTAQVFDRLSGGQFVEGVVGEVLVGASSSRRIAGAPPLSSQAATVPGRSASARAW
jgi:hypothetical protein